MAQGHATSESKVDEAGQAIAGVQVVWSKTAEDILTRERRALDALDQIRGNR